MSEPIVLTDEAKQERMAVVEYLRIAASVYRDEANKEENPAAKSQVQFGAVCFDAMADRILQGRHR